MNAVDDSTADASALGMAGPAVSGWRRSLLFAGVYVLAVYAGRATRVEGSEFALVWPAAAVAFLWVSGSWYSRRDRALDVALLLLATVAVDLYTGLPLSLAVVLACAYAVQAVVSTAVFARLQPAGWLLRRPVDLTALLFAATAGAAASALIGPIGLWLSSDTDGVALVGQWLLRNTASTFVIAAVGLRLRHRGVAARLGAVFEQLTTVLLVTGTFAVVFLADTGLPLTFLLLLPSAWVALKYPTTAAAGYVLATAVAVLVLTDLGLGPFGSYTPGTRALLVQLFMSVLCLLTLMLALDRDERQVLADGLDTALQQAHEQSRLLEAIFASISDGVAVVDADGRFVLHNPAARSLLGLDLTGQGPDGWSGRVAAHHPGGRLMADAELPLSRALTGESVRDVDLLIRNPSVPDGRLINVSAEPLPGPAGGHGAVAAFHDVTEVRSATRRIAAAHDLMRGVLDAATEQAIIAVDTSGRVSMFNRGAERMLGYSEAEVIGRGPEVFFDAAEVAARAAELGVAPGWEIFVHAAEAGRAETRQWTFLPRQGGRVSVLLSVTAIRNDGTGDVTGYIGVATDVTERLRVEAALAESEQRFRLAYEKAPIGMFLASLDPATGHRISDANAAMSRFTGRSRGELLRTGMEGLSEPGQDEADAAVTRLLHGETDHVFVERRYRHADGHAVWGQQSASVVRPSDGRPPYLLSLVQDITARKHAEATLTHQALHDSLTGLPNRLLLADRLEQAIAVTVRSAGQVGLLYLDLDGFKAVNDSVGHAEGDRLLVEVAARLQTAIRPEDTACRLGGDEFAVLCPAVSGVDDVTTVGERVLAALRVPFELAGGARAVSASIGVAIATAGARADQVLKDADDAMYTAKRTGKNRLVVCDPQTQARAARYTRLLPELEQALDTGALVMFGQPVVDLASGRLGAVETLIRWQHPARGLLSPADFLDVAEASPLMIRVGQRALDESCRLAAAWTGLLGEQAPDVHVNISGRQLEKGDLSQDVLAALERHGLPADKLVLELTESYTPMFADSLLADLQRLRDRGVRLALDDLGTGYSSLARITDLPFDILKIDLRFVAGLSTDPGCAAVVRAVLGLGAALGLGVVAEGIETPEQAVLLRQDGCETGQGYLYSRPLPETQLLDYMRKQAVNQGAP